MQPQFRSSAEQIGGLLVGTPDGQQIPLTELATLSQGNGASFIYRENNSRYIGIQYSIEGRDQSRAVADGQAAIRKYVQVPSGYRLTWGGEYDQLVAAKQQMWVIGPVAVGIIFFTLFALYGNFKFPMAIAIGVIISTQPVGALLALNSPTRHLACRQCWDYWPCLAFRRRRRSSYFPTLTSCALKEWATARRPIKRRCCGCDRL